ncbi:MAG: hypothetical protein H8E84_03605 [Flavobacteriales bacterium]|nr:hypothetical protein [Flavobacteriales bacterium]
MNLTDAQKLAFAREMAEILTNNQAELVAGGYDPAAKITEFCTQSTAAENAEADQQQAQADAKQATMDANDTRDTVYNNASATVELMVGVLGKDNLIVQEIKAIRGEM